MQVWWYLNNLRPWREFTEKQDNLHYSSIVWSLGHGKNILLRTHTKFSTVLFTTHHYCWLFSGKCPHNCNESSAFKMTEFTVTTKRHKKEMVWGWTVNLCLQYSFNIDVDLSGSRAQTDSLNNGSWKLCLFLHFAFLFVSISLQEQGTVFCTFYIFFNDGLAKDRVHVVSEMHMSNVELCMALSHLGMSSCFLSIKYFTWAYSSLIIWKKMG